MFSLGHHGMFAVGAYAAGATVAWIGAPAAGTPAAIALFVGSAVAAVAASSAAGLLVGLPCLRLRGDYLAIATLAFGEIVRIAIENTRALEGSLGMHVPRLVLEPAGRIAAFRTVFLAIALGVLALAAVVV